MRKTLLARSSPTRVTDEVSMIDFPTDGPFQMALSTTTILARVMPFGAVAVGTAIAGRPPGHRGQSPAPDSHRTWRADLPHHALRQLVHSTASTCSFPYGRRSFG